MISFFNEGVKLRLNKNKISLWITDVIKSEGKKEGEINFVFCDDTYLLGINKKYLLHDTYTDIISFDYSVGDELNGDVFISVERVKENASLYQVTFDEELRRVVIHGVLHFCGYKDKNKHEALLMRSKEDEKLSMFHVEQ